jgi:hypothetical protein
MKYKRLLLSERFFIDIFKSGILHVEITNGLPSDAQFVRWFQQDGYLEVVVESDEFPDLEHGDMMPLIDMIQYTRL